MRRVAYMALAMAITASAAHGQTSQPVATPGADSIRLVRGGCDGTCPIYTIEISADGNTIFDGRGFVDVHGTHHYAISKDDAAKLFAAVEADDIWSMRDRYQGQASDGSTHIITVTVGGKTKTIVDYRGQEAGMPPAVSAFEALIDTTGHTEDWIRITPTTLENLKTEGFDFQSQAGADLLAAAIDGRDAADDATILAIVAAGAPLTGGHVFDYGPDDMRQVDIVAGLVEHGRTELADRLRARTTP